jgi:uncharacterized protein (TIGR02246 family)
MTKRRTLLAALAVAPLAALAIIGAGREDDTAAIKQTTKDFQAAWAKHDPKALAALWAKDGDLIDPWGISSSGREGVEKFFAEQHTTGPLAKTTYEVKKDTVRMITPDVAVQDWEVMIGGLPKSDGTLEGPLFHRVTIVEKKEGGSWKIAAARPTMPMPEAAATTPPKAGEKAPAKPSK